MSDPHDRPEPVLYEVRDRIAILTLNRPHRRNAWTGRMHSTYRRLLAEAETDPNVRAVIVTGAQTAFCVGGDMTALEGHVDKGGYDSGLIEAPAMPGAGVDDRFEADFAYHFAMSKPVIAAINGAAAGVGLVLPCFADVRFGVRGAKLTTAHGPIGLPAEYGLSWILPRLIGASRAAELLLTSRVFMTEEAHDIGLVHSLHDPDELLPATFDYARSLIASNAAQSLAAAKHQIYADLHDSVRDSVERAQELLDTLTTTDAFAHGIASLVGKQPPRFDLLDES